MQWIRREIPGPFSINHTNCYLIESDPLSLIDPGPYTEESVRGLEDFLAGRGYRFKDVSRVIVTHVHVDHFGLAGYLQQFGAKIYVGKEDWPKAVHSYSHLRSWWDLFLQKTGCPVGFLQELTPFFDRERKFIYQPREVTILEQDQMLSFSDGSLAVYDAPGHSKGQIVLLDEEGDLFSGDFLLPRVFSSPVLENSNGCWNDPMEEMLATCDNLRDLQVKLVLPGHGEPFRGYQERLEQLEQFHLNKSMELIALTTEGMSIYQATKKIFPRAGGWDLAVTLCQCLAYMKYWNKLVFPNGN